MKKDFKSYLDGKFQSSSLQDWIEKINKDLRSGDYQSLIHHHPDNIDIQPAYTGENRTQVEQSFRQTRYWGVIEAILVEDVASANRKALTILERGTTGLIFYLNGDEDISQLLQNIEIQYIRLRLVVQNKPQSIAGQLSDLLSDRQLDPSNLDIFLNRDPLENLLRTGNWFSSEEEDFSNLAALSRHEEKGINYRSLNVNLFANAGATAVQQLAIALAMTYETHYRLQDETLGYYWVNFAIGSAYFTEIAKLRAFRRLWNKLAYELGGISRQPAIYAETGLRNKSIRDVYNNMIRSTTEAMAAVIGGADEIQVLSFDSTLGEPSPFGERVARNQQHVLQYEGHLSEVHDIASGAYFIENLTEEVATRAWELFVQIEEQGGFLATVRSGWLQKMVEQSAAEEQKAYAENHKLLVGVNKFTREDPDLSEMISRPMFSNGKQQETEVKILKIKRLAEAFEQDLQNA